MGGGGGRPPRLRSGSEAKKCPATNERSSRPKGLRRRLCLQMRAFMGKYIYFFAGAAIFFKGAPPFNPNFQKYSAKKLFSKTFIKKHLTKLFRSQVWEKHLLLICFA
jgi:hypothetical protein